LSVLDFALDDQDAENRAKGAASDGRDAGFDPLSLPVIRAEPRGGL
jgi:hypothetical protein